MTELVEEDHLQISCASFKTEAALDVGAKDDLPSIVVAVEHPLVIDDQVPFQAGEAMESREEGGASCSRVLVRERTLEVVT
jgi:hypothetical protein